MTLLTKNEVGLISAYIIHYRYYRDTSLLVDVFSETHGLKRFIAKGVRTARCRHRSLYQPFIPLWIQWRGKGALPLITTIETRAPALTLSGTALYCGLYVNELIQRLLLQEEAIPLLYQQYEETLQHLSASQDQEIILRRFEKQCLRELGYEPTLDHDIFQQPIDPEQKYYYEINRGFSVASENSLVRPLFVGSDLLAIHQDNYREIGVKKSAKHLFRQLLSPLLGDRPIHSKIFFSQ